MDRQVGPYRARGGRPLGIGRGSAGRFKCDGSSRSRQIGFFRPSVLSRLYASLSFNYYTISARARPATRRPETRRDPPLPSSTSYVRVNKNGCLYARARVCNTVRERFNDIRSGLSDDERSNARVSLETLDALYAIVILIRRRRALVIE